MDKDELELINMFDNFNFQSEDEELDDDNDIDMLLDYYGESNSPSQSSEKSFFFNETLVKQNAFEEFDFKLQNKYNNLIASLLDIINKDPTFAAEIVDNVIIINNILYFLNPQCNNKQKPYGPILRLSEFNKRKLPRRSDPKWWGEKCSNFEDLIKHLCNSTTDKIQIVDKSEIKEIEMNIIDLAYNLVQRDFEFKDITIKMDLLEIYNIAIYLEIHFNKSFGSLYSEEVQYTNRYFLEFRDNVLKKLAKPINKNYSYYQDSYEDQINLALYKILCGARNILILFGPFGYDALKDNLEFIELTWDDVCEFKKEALRYIALNNLVELKCNEKHNNLRNPNDYANFIFKGASLI